MFPSLSFMVTSQPARTRTRIACSCSPDTALIKAVCPRSSLRFGSAPPLSRDDMASVCPFAAACARAVQPRNDSVSETIWRFISAPAANSTSRVGTFPAPAANINGVLLCVSARSTAAPNEMSFSTAAERPNRAAAINAVYPSGSDASH